MMTNMPKETAQAADTDGRLISRHATQVRRSTRQSCQKKQWVWLVCYTEKGDLQLIKECCARAHLSNGYRYGCACSFAAFDIAVQ